MRLNGTNFLRTLIFFTLLLCRVDTFYSYTGAFSGSSNIRLIKTRHFDLIYDDKCARSAIILSSEADAIYSELSKKLSLKHDFHIPVVITSTVDTHNAYYSSAPFSHIVLYDTPAAIDQVSFSNEFINTFRHELIHAITYNLHNKGWTAAKGVFSDALNPALLTITKGFAEGASVSLESDGATAPDSTIKEGRVNSPYHMAFIKQAKLDDKWPLYSEIQGAVDGVNYGKLPYYFGGAFNYYIQNKYGLDKYARFWYKCVNWQTATYFTSFYEVYRIGIKHVWEDFRKSVPVPLITKYAEDQNYCTSLTSHKKIAHLDLGTISTKNYYYYDSDSQNIKSIAIPPDADCTPPATPNSIVKFSKKSANKKNNVKTRTIFNQPNATNLSVSNDDALIAISYTSKNYATPTNRTKIIDTASATYYTVSKKHIRDAAINKASDSYYFACVATSSQYCTLLIYKVIKKGSGVKDLLLLKEITAPYGVAFYKPTITDSACVYYIKVSGLHYTLEGYDIKSGSRTSTPFPRGTRVYSLNSVPASSTLTFSYTTSDTLVRYGNVDTAYTTNKNMTFTLMARDISGGVYNPCALNNFSYYIAQYFDRSTICALDLLKTPTTTISEPCYIEDPASSINERNQQDGASDDKNNNTFLENTAPANSRSKPFNSFTYFFSHKGTFIPLSIGLSMTLNNSAAKTGNAQSAIKSAWIPFGATYVTSTPWTSPIVGLSAGYSPFSNSFGVNFLATNMLYDITKIFVWDIYASVEFDDGPYSTGANPTDTFKQTYEHLSGTLTLDIAPGVYFKVSDALHFFYGRSSSSNILDFTGAVGSLKSNYSDFDVKRLLIMNEAAISIGNIHKVGSGYYDYGGFTLTARYNTNYYKLPHEADDTRYLNERNYQNIGSDLLIRFVAGRPFTLRASLFPDNTYFLDIGGSLMIHTWDIQKSINVVPFFLTNRVSLFLSYSGSFTHETKGEIDYYKNGSLINTLTFTKPIKSWAMAHVGDYFGYLFSRDVQYYDALSIKAAWTLSPNFGGLANSNFAFDISLEAGVRFFTDRSSPFFLAICGKLVL